MSRLIIVSNRLPITIEKRKGKLHFRRSVGGLATGLSSFYQLYDSMWIGWCGMLSDNISREDKKNIENKLITEFKNLPIFLTRREIREYYYGFSNKTVWPLFHYFTHYAVYDNDMWESYKSANKSFCNAILKVAGSDDTIWVHDYHLMLLPKLLREKMPDARIGFFLHIPFPSFEVFRLLPWRREILEGLLGADLVGFHTYDYVRHFLSGVRRLLGYEYTLGQVSAGGRRVKVDAFPMGIDHERFANAVYNAPVKREINRIRKKLGEHKLILSVDRLDYTKGIPQRIEAFNLFLEENPGYKEKVTLIMVAVPSRTAVKEYMLLKKEVDELVGRINGKHGTIGWLPVWYLYRFLSFSSLAALYCTADVALVTPLRDGMNLIAKEYIASRVDGRGVLILSEMAGASKELGESIIVNPNNKEEVAFALKQALEMPNKEQIERNTVMQKRLRRYNVIQWAHDFMDKLSRTKELQQMLYAKKLTQEVKDRLIDDYHKGSRRLLLLDYDGTLIPFAEKPEKARPRRKILELLRLFTREARNEVVIVSGRDRETLNKWFGGLNLALSAEHGVWIKEKDGIWEIIEHLRNNWKEEIRPVLESYVDRTPGSFLEEKEFSLVWHYRKVDPELASVRVGELEDDIGHYTVNLNLGVLKGSKVIEIKNVGINKGSAALHWISEGNWDFILAIGDDRTDEDVFEVLPEWAYSIKVGYGISKAKFNFDSYIEVIELMKKMGGAQ
ncbi:bifunctional alpha,alpha-trehalose-phosphate synthase (UDP-forming)/trehalose-phosphatase [candidate division WOR-3 bacterium JGI_Cruoil_03_44_89]|uniref:Alpha,alpha-trehalose-phosphate synthase n=1 Tax=candidate division WOR-3 bacterium JGI_Cruoil_03_44_89 TaxID=1973748 RepID=A0A235BY91_UNCW3|nr:MAG: bifunctional alpha,alpha-trehalose-phosphate synthase (UDP-forming)/trehalose-phosphatase [candidate division WOR-3 bacterium JGI_Cruoil_03_44_89]